MGYLIKRKFMIGKQYCELFVLEHDDPKDYQDYKIRYNKIIKKFREYIN